MTLITKHHLSGRKYESFLKERRKDPITGDVIKENDKVVICAACKSAFLEGSWEYLGREHCGQRETLTHIPETQKLRFIKQGEKTLFSLQTYSGNLAVLLGVPTSMVGFILILLLATGVISNSWFWILPPMLVAFPFVVNLFTVNKIIAKEKSITLDKGFGFKSIIPIKDIQKIDVAFFNQVEFEMVAYSKYGNDDELSYGYFSLPPTILIKYKGRWSSLKKIKLSEYDFIKEKKKLLNFFDKLSYVAYVTLSTNSEPLREEFEHFVPRAQIYWDDAGLRYFGVSFSLDPQYRRADR